MFNSDEDMTYTWNPVAPGNITITNGSINGGTIVTGNVSTTGPGSSQTTWPNTTMPVLGQSLSGGLIMPNSTSHQFSITAQKLHKPAVSIKNTNTGCSRIKYIIIQQNGDMLELVEKKSVTPREMIGISKFLNVISMAVTPGSGMKVNWSALIKTLKIENHFEKPSVVVSNSSQSDVLEVQLHDSV